MSMNISERPSKVANQKLFIVTSDVPVSGLDAMAFYKASGNPMYATDERVSDISSFAESDTVHRVQISYSGGGAVALTSGGEDGVL